MAHQYIINAGLFQWCFLLLIKIGWKHSFVWRRMMARSANISIAEPIWWWLDFFGGERSCAGFVLRYFSRYQVPGNGWKWYHQHCSMLGWSCDDFVGWSNLIEPRPFHTISGLGFKMLKMRNLTSMWVGSVWVGGKTSLLLKRTQPSTTLNIQCPIQSSVNYPIQSVSTI